MAITRIKFSDIDFWTKWGAAPSAPISYPVPTEIKESVTVKGATGSLTEATGYFNNIEIEIEFIALLNRVDKTFETFRRELNKFCNSPLNNKLEFDILQNKHYKVKTFGVSAVTKKSEYEAVFTIKFVCDPFIYSNSNEPVTKPGTIEYNGDIPNAPIISFVIEGSGSAQIICNGKQLLFEVNTGTIEINKNPFSVVTLNGDPVKSQGDRPVLLPDMINTLTIEGITYTHLKIIKNERYLG